MRSDVTFDEHIRTIALLQSWFSIVIVERNMHVHVHIDKLTAVNEICLA